MASLTESPAKFVQAGYYDGSFFVLLVRMPGVGERAVEAARSGEQPFGIEMRLQLSMAEQLLLLFLKKDKNHDNNITLIRISDLP